MAIDVATTKLMWALAKLAYEENHTLAAQHVARLGLEGYVPFDAGRSTQGFGCYDGNRRFLAFRGTQRDPIDWITDARFGPVRGELDGSVHSGFRAALDEVWADVADFLDDTARPAWITGHSLGAALATLAAARHVASRRAIGGVFTFGQPRTGHGNFRSAYDRRLRDVTFRFVNHIDLVTRVPLLLLRYRHVGRRMYWDAGGDFHADASWWHIAKDDLKFRFAHFGRIDESLGVLPHFVPAYTERVEAL